MKSDGTVTGWGMNIGPGNYVNTQVAQANLTHVTAVSAGEHHWIALKSDGTVVGGGFGDHGRINTSSFSGVDAISAGAHYSLMLIDGKVHGVGQNYHQELNIPAGLSNVTAIAAGYYHALALKEDGTVTAWGNGYWGDTPDVSTVPAELTGETVVAIAAGDDHSLALKEDGKVVAWGRNTKGQSTVPAGLTDVVDIDAGFEFSLALKSDGKVVAWGDMIVPEGLTDVVDIDAGYSHAMALRDDGSVVVWMNGVTGLITTVPGSGDLSGLALQEGPLDKPFQASDTDYTFYNSDPDRESVHLTATLADADNAALYINDELQTSGSEVEVDLTGDVTEISIRVEPYLLPGKTYTVTVADDMTPPNVHFGANGGAEPEKNAVTTVTVSDAASGLDEDTLEYAWSEDASTPDEGWTNFTNGATVEKTSGDGNWYLRIRARDLAGNVVDAVSNAFVLDNTAPVITLNGSNPMNIPQGGTYTEPGATALDTIDGAIPDSSIAISGAVDTARLGNYTVQYTAADRAGNTATVTRDVYVYDGDEPAIDLIGPNPMTVEANSPFADPGATAYDVQDGDLTASIQVTGAVDPSTLGTYTLSYDVSDTAGNAAATVTRTVYVQDTQPPVLTLLGDPAMSVPVGAAFADPGAQATDAYYGDVSPLIVVNGTVDTRKTGTYTLRYNVTDPSGNAAAEATRTVTVTAADDSDDSDDPGNPGDSGTDESSGSGGSVGIFQVSVKINGVVKRVDASYETAGGQRVIRIFPTAEQLSEAFATDPEGILIEAQDIGDAVKMDLPAAPLLNAVKLRQDARLEWSVNGNGLRIPLHVLQGVSDEETVTFMIAATAGFAGVDWNDPITRVEGELLLPHPVVYTLQAKHGDSIDWPLTNALLTAHLPEPANPYQATAVRIDENGRIRFAPSIFSNNGLVTIRSPYGGAYAVIETDHSFADVNGHWAQEDIILMANKLLVEGRGQGLFVPDDSVSRAEFAAMLVRALGLEDEPDGSTPFRDVAPGAWYAGAVRAAQQHQLVVGFEDGTFRPTEPITREQTAVMIVRAMEYAGSVPVADGTAAEMFGDAADIAPWARDAVDRLTGASIIRGLTETKFGPREHASRAQSAALLKRTLQAMQFINP
ncbi:hypothetical protein J19TS2_59520 [Cohnella xylanilytica]|nr:hypothetical protein J19TS2_59520 [Cohnella xylanilytica]